MWNGCATFSLATSDEIELEDKFQLYLVPDHVELAEDLVIAVDLQANPRILSFHFRADQVFQGGYLFPLSLREVVENRSLLDVRTEPWWPGRYAFDPVIFEMYDIKQQKFWVTLPNNYRDEWVDEEFTFRVIERRPILIHYIDHPRHQKCNVRKWKTSHRRTPTEQHLCKLLRKHACSMFLPTIF